MFQGQPEGSDPRYPVGYGKCCRDPDAPLQGCVMACLPCLRLRVFRVLVALSLSR